MFIVAPSWIFINMSLLVLKTYMYIEGLGLSHPGSVYCCSNNKKTWCQTQLKILYSLGSKFPKAFLLSVQITKFSLQRTVI